MTFPRVGLATKTGTRSQTMIASGFASQVLVCRAYLRKKGGNLNAVMNAANEVANAAFRNHEIPFLKIEEIVIGAVHHAPFKELTCVQDVIDADTWGREYALNVIKGVNQ